jgi:hypothetical protein
MPILFPTGVDTKTGRLINFSKFYENIKKITNNKRLSPTTQLKNLNNYEYLKKNKYLKKKKNYEYFVNDYS